MKETYFAGIDVGTSHIKVVLIDGSDEVRGSHIRRSGADLQASISTAFEEAMANAGAIPDDVVYTVATGFGRGNVTFGDESKTEISCHARGAHHYFPGRLTIIDIGGQDTKVIKIDDVGKTIRFRMNRKCAAGTGAFLEEIAHKLDIPMDEMNALAHKSTKDTALGSYCTVFASTEILTRIREGENVEDMAKSAFESVARRVIEMDSLEGRIVMTGGVVAYNDIVKTILERHTGNEILVPPEPQLIGAFGAALFAKEAKLES
ncbi:MAG: ATPase [Candidatus Proteinoplasmatales archaeon SG8-5]|nr:MAG: ATPase [Candidatus Proteinoplasmatales archaeon SG8-5]